MELYALGVECGLAGAVDAERLPPFRRGSDGLLRSPWPALGSGMIRSAEGYLGSMSRLARITTDPDVCHGQPTVRGMRYPVEMLLELLASGMSTDEILDDYDDLERGDILATLEFGALTSGMRRVIPLGAR